MFYEKGEWYRAYVLITQELLFQHLPSVKMIELAIRL